MDVASASSDPARVPREVGEQDREVAALLVGGADPGARSDDGLTALDYAVQRGHPEAAEVLSGSRSAFLLDTGLRSPEDLRWFGLQPAAR
jgi:ankyrin repeat protein